MRCALFNSFFCYQPLFLLQYDMKLYEDENVNRMHEAIQLFDEICNSKWFKSTSMILFLNKSDLFKDKIQNVDMNVCFSDYTGGKSYKNGCAYLKARDFFLVPFRLSNISFPAQVQEAESAAEQAGVLAHYLRHRHGEHQVCV